MIAWVADIVHYTTATVEELRASLTTWEKKIALHFLMLAYHLLVLSLSVW